MVTTKNKKVKVKGNVDAELVLHTMIEYRHYKKAVIASGDGDFRCLVEYLDQKDLWVIPIIFHQHYLLKRLKSYDTFET